MIRVSDDQMSQFKKYAQYAGASYCDVPTTQGEAMFCVGDICPDATGQNVTIWQTFM